MRIDTTDRGSIAAAAKEVLANHPDLNVLIPMAGIMRTEDWTTPAGFLGSAEAVADRAAARPGGQRARHAAGRLRDRGRRPARDAAPPARDVKFLRYGEARGDYDQVAAALDAAAPDGR